jgi:aspartate-semialdehyde dehydrogenase
MDGFKVAIVGATSLAGQEIIRVLEQRNFPVSSLHLYSSGRGAGRHLYYNHQPIQVGETGTNSFSNIDIAFFVATDEVSRHFAPRAVDSGALAVDTSTVFRMEPMVPLIIPEINPDDMKNHQGIVACPGCTTIEMVLPLHPLHKVNPIKRIVVATYQSASGLGSEAMDELTLQTKQVMAAEGTMPRLFPHQIGFNILPQVGVFMDSGYTREELSLGEETQKVLHDPDITVSATCVRVPVYIGHCASINVEFSHPVDSDEAEDVLSEAPGVRVIDDPTVNLYPQPWTATGMDEVLVGRIRQDFTHPSGLAMWVAVDNIRKGASLNSVQIAEEITRRGWLKSRG